MLKLGVVGCGTIGAEICKAVDAGQVEAELVGVSDIDLPKAQRLSYGLRRAVPVLSQTDLIRLTDLVVEAVSKAVAPVIIREALAASKDMMVMSVGGLLACLEEAVAVAKRSGRRIYVPSGAIAGPDAVKGAAVGHLSQVTLTTRKPPHGFEGAPYVIEQRIDLAALRQPTVLFSGSPVQPGQPSPASRPT
jgi:aspartate dehydrogenase